MSSLEDEELEAGEVDDGELEGFVSLARAAVQSADSPPDDVSELAKLAYEFRGVETVETLNTSELAGVRSASAGLAMQATKAGTTIIWSSVDGAVSGVVHAPGDGAELSLAVQTPETVEPVVVNQDDGSFEFPDPRRAHRIVVTVGEAVWATPWAN